MSDCVAEHYMAKCERLEKHIADLEMQLSNAEPYLEKAHDLSIQNQQLRDEALEERASYEAERQRLRDALDQIHEILRIASFVTDAELYARAKECYHIAKQALEKET